MSDKVEQFCMAGAPPEAVLCALMDESNQLRAELTELNARIDDRNAALLSKTVELSECQKQLDELADELSECQKDRDYFKANDRCAMRYLSDVCNIVGGKDFPDMVKQVAVLQKQRDDKVQCCPRCYSVFPTQSEGGAA